MAGTAASPVDCPARRRRQTATERRLVGPLMPALRAPSMAGTAASPVDCPARRRRQTAKETR
eukprot:9910109-Alexandrium_andersonii.AAC.1